MDNDSVGGMHHVAQPLGVEHHFYLDFAIEEPEPFYDFFTTLRTASPEDVVFLHINSLGGRISTMTQVIGAIQSAPCSVIGVAEGDVASAAAYIFFSCHGFQVADYSQFLVHNGMGGYIGKPNDHLAVADANNQQIKKVIKGTLSLFFSKKEIKSILNGREFCLSGEEVVERLKKAEEKMEGQIEEE